MAKFVLKNARIEIDATDLSDHFSSVTIEDTADEVEFTAFGSGYREFGQGLKDATITATAFQDFEAGEVDATLAPLYASGDTFDVKVRAENAPISTENPEYSLTSRLYSFSPIAGDVGDASTTEITFRNAGQDGLTRTTTPPA